MRVTIFLVAIALFSCNKRQYITTVQPLKVVKIDTISEGKYFYHFKRIDIVVPLNNLELNQITLSISKRKL